MDRFTTPEPSEEAVMENCGQRANLRRAYAVDMERIVREELSHLHGFLTRVFRGRGMGEILDRALAEYRKERFGEAVLEKCRCVEETGYPCRDCGSEEAPTERREPITIAPPVTWSETFTNKNRDRLAKMEAFLDALALAETQGPAELRAYKDAAREYLR